jgi:hypothetical protein
MKRMRKAGITDPATGEHVPFPYMPRITRFHLGGGISRRRTRSSI